MLLPTSLLVAEDIHLHEMSSVVAWKSIVLNTARLEVQHLEL